MRTSTAILSTALFTLFLTSCQQQADDQLSPQPKADPTEALTTQQLDSQILSRLRETGRFDWNQASEHFVWSALTRSDYVLSVGYKPAGFVGELPPMLPRRRLGKPPVRRCWS
ncbi:hypothetical protein H9L05_02120 [Hymenobacter qilianensis]|uniref:Uncharacterized protein n=1 Tax=Hymenobacter qilianensis TaxID=1385715 RepID=A0A7H0GWB9_9BACT|nr:hypothetical protein [Hymenobacter qilianensis]QNP52585.1 hypothetical protein H9L05_02120 [Hymenobacter qilianensis]